MRIKKTQLRILVAALLKGSTENLHDTFKDADLLIEYGKTSRRSDKEMAKKAKRKVKEQERKLKETLAK